MKKLILSLFILLIFTSILPIFSAQVNAQPKEIACEEISRILFESGDCPNWTVPKDGSIGIWCNMPVADIDAWKRYPPTYVFPPGVTCPSGTWGSASTSQDEETDQKNQLPEEQSGKNSSFLPINPFQIWLRIKALANLPEVFRNFASGEYFGGFSENPEINYEANPARYPWLENVASIEFDREVKYIRISSTDEPSGAQIQLPDQSEYQDLQPKQKIPDGSYIRVDRPTRFEVGSEGILEVRPTEGAKKAEFQFKKYGKDNSIDLVNLNNGEMEIFLTPLFAQPKREISKDGYFRINTPNAQVLVIQTHFRVGYGERLKKTTVTVFKGTVEVKTKRGDKSVAVSPDGDQSGSVVVSQKLSVTKLLIPAVIIAVAFVWFLKRRKRKR
ncbi:FecR domain-containing protein [Candidatus Roizmanbacteria bacterium]|nr:FecR domain-containing protein [Candidatus Roizmanbacteria bacterium]